LAVLAQQVALDREGGGVVAHGLEPDGQPDPLADRQVGLGAGRLELLDDRLAHAGEAGDAGDPEVALGRLRVADPFQRLPQVVAGDPTRGRDRDPGAEPRIEVALRHEGHAGPDVAGLVLDDADAVSTGIEGGRRERRLVVAERVDEEVVGERGRQPRSSRAPDGSRER
jgi:hypothetical protein